eukprot:gene2219-5230_t
MRSVSLSSSWEDVRTLPTTIYAPPPPPRKRVSKHKATFTDPQRISSGTYATSLLTQYNSTYPLTAPQDHGLYVSYRIAFITDQDKQSKTEDGESWESDMLTGELRQFKDGRYAFHLDPSIIKLSTSFNAKGRGAELSELQVFNGKLYTADDRTGIIYEVVDQRLVPRFILSDGDGNQQKGLKIEWMTVKNRQLWVGGIGKDWTTATGEYVNAYPKWIKIISQTGTVRHVDWRSTYDSIQNACGAPCAGRLDAKFFHKHRRGGGYCGGFYRYLWHEAVAWHPALRRWIFLPRRASSEPYDETEDEHRAANIMITSDVAYNDIIVSKIGKLSNTRGFSSFKLIPGSNGRHILAVKSEEVSGSLASYITVLDIELKKELLSDQLIGDSKVEGVEFI